MFVPENNPEFPTDEETMTKKKKKKDEDFVPMYIAREEQNWSQKPSLPNSKY